MGSKRAQIGVEYLILIGFLTFVIIGFFSLSFYMKNKTQDSIRDNQLENYARKIISNSESIFYSGEPSRTQLEVYLPDGIEYAGIVDNELVFNVSTSSGTSVIGFASKVPLEGTLSNIGGIQRIVIVAGADKVIIS